MKTFIVYSPFIVALLAFFGFACTVEAAGGDPFAPEMPSGAIWAWNWLYSTLIVLFVLLIPALLVRAALKAGLGLGCPRLVWLIALPIAAGFIAFLGCRNGAKLPAVEEVELSFENLPESLDGYRILQLSDIHARASAPRARTEAIVARANAAGANLICLTGDYVDGFSRRQYRNVEPLRNLAAPDGVVAVTGNHEYYFDHVNWSARYQMMTNITFLADASVSPREGLVVAGVRDSTGYDFGYFPPDPDKALHGATNGAFRVLLQHRPAIDFMRYLGRLPTERVDLQLSGHTHGGIAPGMRQLVALSNKGLVRGVYSGEDGRTIHVSAGAGQWAGFPVRFFNDPSMTVITLRRKGGEATRETEASRE